MAAQVPVLTFSDNDHSRSSLALVFRTNNDIELKSSIGVANHERTQSEVNKSKFKTEIKEYSVWDERPFSDNSKHVRNLEG